MEPTSATLAGRFFTTKPPGKPGYSLSTRKIISDGKRMVKDVKIKKVKIMWIEKILVRGYKFPVRSFIISGGLMYGIAITEIIMHYILENC